MVLEAFHREYPGVTYFVEVSGTSRLLDLIAADQLDVALAFNAPDVEYVRHVYEMLLPTRLLVNDSHPLAKRRTVSLADLADCGLALPDQSMGAKSIYDTMFSEARIRPRSVLVTNSYELIRAVSAAGLSAAIVNEHLTNQYDQSLGYRYLPIRDARVKSQRLTVCIRDGRKLSSAAVVFIDHLEASLRALKIRPVSQARKAKPD
jgi:DNA-binding transcriptional LysR family regulator